MDGWCFGRTGSNKLRMLRLTPIKVNYMRDKRDFYLKTKLIDPPHTCIAQGPQIVTAWRDLLIDLYTYVKNDSKIIDKSNKRTFGWTCWCTSGNVRKRSIMAENGVCVGGREREVEEQEDLHAPSTSYFHDNHSSGIMHAAISSWRRAGHVCSSMQRCTTIILR